MKQTIDDVILELQRIICDVLDNEAIKVTADTTMDDVDEWDSVAHIEIVAEIMRHFDLKFTTEEMSLWETVGDMAASIVAKSH